MRCLALEMRCAIVASSTMNALAISAVVSPPTARSVSAIAEAGVSAGWQHMNSTVNVSSSSDTSRPGGSAQCSDRLPVPAGLLAAPLVDQPPLGGLDQPAAGAVRDAVPRPVHRTPRAAPPGRHPRRRRSRRTCGRARRGPAARARAAGPRRRTGPSAHASAAHSSRTWIGCWSATPSGPGTAEYLAAISIARSSVSTSTIM